MSDEWTCECCNAEPSPGPICDYCAMGECSLCGGEFE